MAQYSSREVAKKVKLHLGTLQRYIAEGKVPAPPLLQVGAGKLRIWSDNDVNKVLETLPKIANGRKTRYKKQSALSNQQSAKTKKKTQARVPASQKKK